MLEQLLQSRGYLVEDNALPEELDLQLKSAFYDFIDEILSKRRTIIEDSFEDSQNRADDLKDLKVPLKELEKVEPGVFNLPIDYLHHIRSKSYIVKDNFEDWSPNRIVDEQYYNEYSRDHNFKSTPESPLCIISGNTIISDESIDKIKMSYIKDVPKFDYKSTEPYPASDRVLEKVIKLAAIKIMKTNEQNPNKINNFQSEKII